MITKNITNRLTGGFFALLAVVSIGLAACGDDAQIASRNVSKAADNFEINRRIVFFNGITDKYILVVEGFCSQEQTANKLAVICKVGPNAYKKHFLGLSDNVTYFSEQLDNANVSAYNYRVTFKPESILPSIDLRTSLDNK